MLCLMAVGWFGLQLQIYLVMAFVSQSRKDVPLLPKNRLHQIWVGPGSYETNNHHQKKSNSSAPFTSSSQKYSLSNKNIMPGPGQYKIQNEIGLTNIKTYSNDKTIIIKINSTVQPFSSKQKRFADHENSMPGPGEYFFDEDIPEKKEKKKHHYKHIKHNKNSSLNHPSIVSKTFFLNQKAVTEPAIGMTDEMDKFISKKKGSLASVWGKDKVQRFSTFNTEVGGPGQYNTELVVKEKKQNKSSVFASNTVKSIFDTICYDTLNQQTLDVRLNIDYKSELPAPGSYDLESRYSKDKNNDKYKNQSFGSRNARFQEKIDVRPCIAVIQKQKSKTLSFNKKQIPFNTEAKRTELDKDRIQFPGPGDYQNTFHGYFYQIRRPKIQNFGSFVRRPFFQQTQQQKVGPGSYSLEAKKVKATEPTQSVIFKSKIPRLSTEPSKTSDIKFGNYDVERNDINRKILQTKIHRQNLHKINCEKPAFDMQSLRFKHYEEQTKSLSLKDMYVKHSLKLKEKKEDLRQKLIQEARTQVVDGKGYSINRGGERFKQDKKGPGAGEYSIRQNWTKKSYNIKYNNFSGKM